MRSVEVPTLIGDGTRLRTVTGWAPTLTVESIVESMESGDLPLESLLSRFEEGTRLVKACQTKLEEAELKISQLEKNAAGEPVLKPASVSLPENDE